MTLRITAVWAMTAAALAFMVTCGPARAAADSRPPLLLGVHRIVTMGASITQYAARPGGYVWLTRQYLNAIYPDQPVEVIDAGVSGNMSSDMLARFQKDVIDRKPDLITIKAGFNDLWRKFNGHPEGDGPGGHSASEYTANVESMVNMARAAGIRVLIMTPTIWEDTPDSMHNQKLKEYVDGIRDLARRRSLPLADQNAALLGAWQQERAGKIGRLTTDHVHLTLVGDAVVARTLLLAMGVPESKIDASAGAVAAELNLALHPAKP